MNLTSLSIGIPAYNEENNITQVVNSILQQKLTKSKILEIIIVIDGSYDNTEKNVRYIESKLIKIINIKKNQGVANAQNLIFKNAQSDITLLFNADIILNNDSTIENLVNPIIENRADFTAAKISEIKGETEFEKTLIFSMDLKRILFKNIRHGDNLYCCHGPGRAFSKELYKKIIFPQNGGEDMYSYLFAKYNKYRFKFIESAVLLYKIPNQFKDHYRQAYRFRKSIQDMNKYFPEEFVKREFKISLFNYLISTIKSFPYIFSNLHLLIIYIFLLMRIYLIREKVTENRWSTTSTKNLN